MIISANAAALNSIAAPEPSAAAMAPASAGPIARATLYATAFSAIARGSSSRPTSSLTLADCAGR